jgi:hypothetical protein
MRLKPVPVLYTRIVYVLAKNTGHFLLMITRVSSTEIVPVPTPYAIVVVVIIIGDR